MPRPSTPDPDHLNQQRSKWAERSLLAFANQTGQSVYQDGWEGLAVDLLSNLGHLCDDRELKLASLLWHAANQYREETDGEGPQSFVPMVDARLEALHDEILAREREHAESLCGSHI